MLKFPEALGWNWKGKMQTVENYGQDEWKKQFISFLCGNDKKKPTATNWNKDVSLKRRKYKFRDYATSRGAALGERGKIMKAKASDVA